MTTPDRPTGTVTFLFTDIEGSTRFVQSLGAAGWAPVVARHRELIRGALEAHHGAEIQTEGDGFFAAFQDAREAIRAVVAAQQALAAEPWPDETPIRVRMGLHTGEGVLDAERLYVGADVHIAARVAAAGHGGQVVLSAATVGLVERELPPGVTVRRLGEHRLKDLRPELLWDLVIEGLDADFPPIRSLDARPNNLPTQLTSFVGRERELVEARELLLRSRLLTLTGPGGTGKTRLSLQLAGDVMEAFPGGIYFVALAGVTDPSLVLTTIGHAVGVPEPRGRRPIDVLTDALTGRKLLLVLDNFEQLVDAAGDVADLLRALPQLTVVATSRAVLRISGEQEYAVGGLPVPPDLERLSPVERERLRDEGSGRTPEDLLRFEAVRLFVARAQSVRPDFALTDAEAAVVGRICTRVAGMPLAIELAAARVRYLSPTAILDRLGHQLDLLASGSRDVPERQRTLRGAIAWSHDLLDEPCRRLLERLSVFAGGFTLEDAEVVGGPADELGQQVMDGLASLVDQSLLRLQPAGSDTRYLMLEPIAEFALERLEKRAQTAPVRDRHAARFLDVAEECAPLLTGADQRRCLDRFERDVDNLRAALDHVIAAGDARAAMRFVIALWRFWQIRGHLVAGFARARDVLAMPGARDHRTEWLGALDAVGGLAWWVADYTTCRRCYEEVLAARREEGDDRAIAQALYNLAFPYMFGSGDFDAARVMYDEARERFQRAGDADGEARTWWGIGNTAYGRRDVPLAREASRRAIEHFRAAHLPFDLAWALYTRGQVELVAADPTAARTFHREALDLFDQVDDVAGIVLAVDALAGDAWFLGEHATAARLSGAVARLERTTGTGLNSSNRQLVGFDPRTLEDDPATAAAWAEGDGLGLRAVVAFARGDVPATGEPSAEGSADGPIALPAGSPPS